MTHVHMKEVKFIQISILNWSKGNIASNKEMDTISFGSQIMPRL